MLKLDLHIAGSGWIAPEAGKDGGKALAVEPDYTGLIPPMQLRRTGKAVRMGIGAAHACLQNAGVSAPDGIVVGTALGCLQDTEHFLAKMIAQDEQMLTPTAFIQSTHNTIAGQIALLAGCQGYNNTLSQRGHSFEAAVLNAAVQLEENGGNLLCGGVDELTETASSLLIRGGAFDNADVPGEGAGFLLLRKSGEPGVCIQGLHFLTDPNANTAVAQLQEKISSLRQTDDALMITGKTTILEPMTADWPDECVARPSLGEPYWETSIALTIARIASDWPVAAPRLWVVSGMPCGDYALWLLCNTVAE